MWHGIIAKRKGTPTKLYGIGSRHGVVDRWDGSGVCGTGSSPREKEPPQNCTASDLDTEWWTAGTGVEYVARDHRQEKRNPHKIVRHRISTRSGGPLGREWSMWHGIIAKRKGTPTKLYGIGSR